MPRCWCACCTTTNPRAGMRGGGPPRWPAAAAEHRCAAGTSQRRPSPGSAARTRRCLTGGRLRWPGRWRTSRGRSPVACSSLHSQRCSHSLWLRRAGELWHRARDLAGARCVVWEARRAALVADSALVPLALGVWAGGAPDAQEDGRDVAVGPGGEAWQGQDGELCSQPGALVHDHAEVPSCVPLLTSSTRVLTACLRQK